MFKAHTLGFHVRFPQETALIDEGEAREGCGVGREGPVPPAVAPQGSENGEGGRGSRQLAVAVGVGVRVWVVPDGAARDRQSLTFRRKYWQGLVTTLPWGPLRAGDGEKAGAGWDL